MGVCVRNLTWRTAVATAMILIAANTDRALFMFRGCAKYGREISSLNVGLGSKVSMEEAKTCVWLKFT